MRKRSGAGISLRVQRDGHLLSGAAAAPQRGVGLSSAGVRAGYRAGADGHQ